MNLDRPPVILYCVNVDWFFVSHRMPIAVEARRRGYEVHVAASITDKLDVLVDSGFHVHPIAIDRSSQSIFSAMFEFFRIFCVIRSVRPDVVHLVTIKPVIFGSISSRLLRVKGVVAAVSGLGFVFSSSGFIARIRRYLVKILYRMAFGGNNIVVVFQNDDDRSKLKSITNLDDAKIRMIRGSGVDLSAYRATSLPVGVPVVALISRLLVEKGVREFVESARLFRNTRNMSARFVVVGSPDFGNPGSISQHELDDWEAEGVVEIWGYRKDVPDVLSQASIVVLPSFYREGVPKVLIEAAACGRPIVTTDLPGCRDAIKAGISGLLVPPRDAFALEKAIYELASDPVRCQAMGVEGRTLAESMFDLSSVISEHHLIYEDLLRR